MKKREFARKLSNELLTILRDDYHMEQVPHYNYHLYTTVDHLNSQIIQNGYSLHIIPCQAVVVTIQIAYTRLICIHADDSLTSITNNKLFNQRVTEWNPISKYVIQSAQDNDNYDETHTEATLQKMIEEIINYLHHPSVSYRWTQEFSERNNDV